MITNTHEQTYTFVHPDCYAPQKGRKLEGETHTELMAQLHEGEHLIAHYEGAFAQAVVADNPVTFSEFEYSAAIGRKKLLGYYALKGVIGQHIFEIDPAVLGDDLPF